MIATRQAAAVATALIEPMSATASADCAANRLNPREWSGSPGTPFPRTGPKAKTTGNNTHGANIIGRVSEEIEPSVVSTRGERTKATAAMTRELRLPIPRASATRMMPQKPAIRSSAHQMRWVTHGGTFANSPSAKNGPCGKKYP